MQRIAAALGVLALGACITPTASTPSLSIDQGKRVILAAKSRVFRDPSSVRDASIGAPKPYVAGTYLVCLEANARNAFGGYTGMTMTVVQFRPDGTVIDSRPAHFTDGCSGLQPFPELARS